MHFNSLDEQLDESQRHEFEQFILKKIQKEHEKQDPKQQHRVEFIEETELERKEERPPEEVTYADPKVFLNRGVGCMCGMRATVSEFITTDPNKTVQEYLENKDTYENTENQDYNNSESNTYQ